MPAGVRVPSTFEYRHLEGPADDEVACSRSAPRFEHVVAHSYEPADCNSRGHYPEAVDQLLPSRRAKSAAEVQDERRLAAQTIQRAYRNYHTRMIPHLRQWRSSAVDLRSGELSHWQSQTLRFLYYPKSVVKDPDMYLAMIGELFGLISLVCFVITLRYHPEAFSSNPILSSLGYNNICVVFDTTPARQVAAVMWSSIIYCTVEYSRIVVGRINTTLKHCPSWKLLLMKACHSVYAVTSAAFLLCFMFPPTKCLTWHTRPYLAYMIFKYLSTLCTVWEARLVGKASSLKRITCATWVFMAFFGFLSLAFLPVSAELSYAYYEADKTRGPFLNPYIFGAADWSWFLCCVVYSYFLPKPALLVKHRAVQRETLERLRSVFGSKAAQSNACSRRLRRLGCCRRRSSSIADLHLRAAEREDLATSGAARITELSDVFASLSREAAAKDPTCTSDPRTGLTISIMKATLTIDDRVEQLAPWHRCGLFATPGRYSGFVRINVTEHGAARLSIRLDVPDTMELLDECQRGDGRAGVRQVDLLLAEGLEQFVAPTPDALLEVMQLMRKPSLRGLLRIPALWRAHRGFQRALRGLDSTKGVSGKAFYSGLPFKLGSGACKFGLTPKMDHQLNGEEMPCGTPGAPMTGSEEEVTKKYAAAMVKQLSEASTMEWDFRVQVAKCERSHNLGQGDAAWSSAVSPYVAVGSLRVHGEPGRAGGVAEQEGPPLYFNPWNTLKAHEPLGALNRARLSVYREHQAVRQRAGGGKQPDRVCPFLASLHESFV